jgi:hypothetical protein
MDSTKSTAVGDMAIDQLAIAARRRVHGGYYLSETIIATGSFEAQW